MTSKKNGNGNGVCPKCAKTPKSQECNNKRQALSQLKRKR